MRRRGPANTSLFPLALALGAAVNVQAEDDREARKVRCERALDAHETALVAYWRAPRSEEAPYEKRLEKREEAVKHHCAGFDIRYRVQMHGKGSRSD